MQVNAHSQMKSTSGSPEYTVYAYNKYCGDVIGYNKWQCLHNSDNKEKALAEAMRLFETEKFEKIEVKEKLFNSKQQKHVVSVCHVLDVQPQGNKLFISMLALMAFSATILLILEMV